MFDSQQHSKLFLSDASTHTHEHSVLFSLLSNFKVATFHTNIHILIELYVDFSELNIRKTSLHVFRDII